MDLIIHSYGYSTVIYHTLQALAMFRNSDFYPTLVITMTLLVSVFYAMRIAGSMNDGAWRQYLVKIFGMAIFINALILPKTSMLIKDHVEKSIYKVDNIPLAFALPIGVLESFGHVLTMGFEQTFSRIGSNSAYNYYTQGMVFGARLNKEVLNAKIRNPETAYNMKNFLERCVINNAEKGNKYSLSELLASEDMWKLVKDNAGNLLRVDMVINGKSEMPNCQESVNYFERKFDQEIHSIIQYLTHKFRGAGNQKDYNLGARQLNNVLKESIGAIYGNESTVDSLLKHNMLINSMDKNIAGKYPAVKALMQAEAGGLLSADMADKTLVGSLAVMKVIIYSAFIFLLPLMILSGGIGKYKMWILSAFSLTLWPPLFSVLNMIIDFAYEPMNIVSYSSWSTEYKKVDSIAAIAGNLTLMIPFLAFWMTKIGEGGFVHLASAVMANASSATSAMAGEKSSGRREWDNESIGNSTREVTQRNKYDDNMQYVTGNQTFSRRDGGLETITAGGNVISIGGAGHSSSTGEASYSEFDGVSSALHNSIRDERQTVDSLQASYTKAEESMRAKEAAALYQIAQNTRTDKGYSIDTSTEEGRAINKALNEIDRINETNEYGWQQNAEVYLKTDLTLGGMVAKAIGIDIGGGTKISASNYSSQVDSNIKEVVEDISASHHTNNNERTSNTESYMDSLGIDKNTQDSMRESYSEMKRLEKTISKHQDNIAAYNEALEYTNNHGSEYRRDMTQEVINAYSDKYGVSASDAYKEVARGTKEAQEVFRAISAQKAESIKNQIHAKKGDIIDTSKIDSFVAKHKDNVNKNPGNSQAMQDFKDANDMNDLSNAKKQIADKGSELKDQFSDKQQQNQKKYNEQEQAAQTKHNEQKDNINEHEKNRIGTGLAAHLLVSKDGVGRNTDPNGYGKIFNAKPFSKE